MATSSPTPSPRRERSRLGLRRTLAVTHRGDGVGELVAITPFDTEEEALELANNTKYGLAAYVWTYDLKRAHNFAQNVEVELAHAADNGLAGLFVELDSEG